MSDYNVLIADFKNKNRIVMTDTLYQYDYGQKLQIVNIAALPQTFEAHFSNVQYGGVSITVTGMDGIVDIPNSLLMTGKRIYCWIYVTEPGSGETVYQILLPVQHRPMPEYYDVTDVGVFDSVVQQVGDYAATATAGATSATASAAAAATSASEAAASASAAETAKTAAETAQGKAEDAQAAAETAAQTATQKAQQTAQDADQAAQSASDAESAADRAEAAQTGAESAKTNAETAAQGAAASASAASASATSAGQAATSAGQSATAAIGSATTAQGAAQTATTKAGEASASADAAAASETAAQTAQTAAEAAETNAGQSASTASTKAAEAAQSASNAAASETAAEAAATRAETAAASLTVDSALSDSSVNPVQNKVVTAEFTNVKSAIGEISESSSNIGYVTKFSGTKAISGVTISRKDANTIIAYGTANGWGKFDVLRGNDNVTVGVPTLSANLSAGTYTLVCNTVFDVLAGVDYNSSVAWKSGTTKTFATDVCVWLRVTSSSRNYGTVDNPSEFAFAIYEGEVTTTDIVPAGFIGYDKIARQAIENIENNLSVADIKSVVNEEFDDAKLYNIVPPDIAWLENSIINFNTGGVQSYNDTCVSDYIEIDPTFSYLCNYINVRVIGDSNITDGNVGLFIRTAIAFYDKNKLFVATTSNSTDASKAIPSTAKYVRLTLEKADYIPYAIAFYGNYSTVQYVRYTPYRKQPKQPQFYGYTGFENLKMVMFGDSITHGDLGISDDGISYVDYANDYLRGNIINVGLGGSRLSQGNPSGVGLGSFASLCENIVSDSATAWDALDAYATASNSTWIPHINKLKAMDWNSVQAIGLLYGANDWNNNVLIGTDINNDPTKYDGACVYGLDLLLTKYPHLQIILFTPFYRKIDATRDADTPNTAGYTIFDYGKSLQENVRPVFHCPVVDSGNEVGINRYNIYVYTQLVDGTHPRTNIAQYRLGRYFAEAIKRYIQPF